MKDEQIYWVVKFTKPNGEVGYMNFNYDITRSFKYVATFPKKEDAICTVTRHIKNTCNKNTQVKYWLKENAEVSYVQLSMSVKD